VLSETIDAAGYFSFFWLFLFNRRFRAASLEEWRTGGWLERALMVFEAAVSALVGVGVPGLLLWAVVT
jgi:hypothetical protein